MIMQSILEPISLHENTNENNSKADTTMKMQMKNNRETKYLHLQIIQHNNVQVLWVVLGCTLIWYNGNHLISFKYNKIEIEETYLHILVHRYKFDSKLVQQ